MRRFFLEKITSRDRAIEVLNESLPGQKNPWLLVDSKGDAIAYFNLVESSENPGSFSIEADLSGRHHDSGNEVLYVLEKMRKQIGGLVGSDA
jgi:hypothetical protein